MTITQEIIMKKLEELAQIAEKSGEQGLHGVILVTQGAFLMGESHLLLRATSAYSKDFINRAKAAKN